MFIHTYAVRHLLMTAASTVLTLQTSDTDPAVWEWRGEGMGEGERVGGKGRKEEVKRVSNYSRVGLV